ncbi:MAG: TonB-dependent receptor plug domain-containing protein [Saprospiraceae bacterium]|nr:TonB-dependent receptor plug domain-containing protein [Saprospiraceae bacterium]
MRYTLIALLIGLLLPACFVSKDTPKSDPKEPDAINNLQDNRSLADVLRKYSSLDIRGSGDNVRIYVRGQSTITLETQPLFIVNNTRMGRDYASVNNSINPNEIISVRVLRSLTETAIYGEEGNHGVIIIKTKNTKL